MSTAPTTDQPPGFDTGTPPPRRWWRRKLILIPIAGLALVSAGAVGAVAATGGSRPAAAPASSATAPASPSSAAPAIGPGNVVVSQTVRAGQPFKMSYIENDVQTTWRVTLDSTTCGSGGIFSQKVLAAYYADEGQATVTPTPEPGMKFCLVKFSVTNLSGSNQPWSANGATVNVGMNAYQSDITGPGSDPEGAYTGYAQPAYQTADYGINPGVSAMSWAVYEIPTQATATSVGVPDGQTADGSQQQVLVTE